MVLASRREARGSLRAWLGGLSIVAGIAVASLLFHTWPRHVPALPGRSLDVMVMHAPAARDLDVQAGLRPSVRGPVENDQASLPGPVPPASNALDETPMASAGEPPVVRPGVQVAAAQMTAAIEPRPVTFVTMMEPALVPDGLGVVAPASSEAPSGVAPLTVVTRAVLAAGKGITTGVRLTGASIRSAFF